MDTLVLSQQSKFIGKGEYATFEILKNLTSLPERDVRDFPKIGIYKQVPVSKIYSKEDYEFFKESHQKGSIDIFLVLNQIMIAVRVQGKGHGAGEKHHGRYSIKAPGKTIHDEIQKKTLLKYCQVVDIDYLECVYLFTDKIDEKSTELVVSSFKTAQVSIPKFIH